MNRDILTNKCNDFLDEIMNLNDLPGLAVGVSIGGADQNQTETSPTEFLGVRGYRDYAARTPLEADDIFHCA